MWPKKERAFPLIFSPMLFLSFPSIWSIDTLFPFSLKNFFYYFLQDRSTSNHFPQFFFFFLSKKVFTGNSLAVWWLRLHTSNAGGTCSIPSQRTKYPVCHAMCPTPNYFASFLKSNFMWYRILGACFLSQHFKYFTPLSTCLNDFWR